MTPSAARDALAAALQTHRPDVYPHPRQHPVACDALADAEALLADLNTDGWVIAQGTATQQPQSTDEPLS
ncbi:hypothetical protein ACIQNI_08895 [Streptomyces sp. NPDC091266]|uniref:hypothetical protein n=1 Tax=Streptomyces sp. NPDC091266 TaxID=3365978 RepID=UPI0038308635